MSKIKNFKLFNESEVVDTNDIELSRLKDDDPNRHPSISILGGEKSEEKFRDAFKDSIMIPQHPATGDVTYDGNKIGFVNEFSGLVINDIKWIETHLEKLNEIVNETGFWYE